MPTATSPRVRYSRACQAKRAASARTWVKDCAHLGPRTLRVYDWVTSYTQAWSRLVDRTTIRRIARDVYGLDELDEVARWQTKRVGESLRKLRDAGVITYSASIGRSGSVLVGLPEPADPVDSPPAEPEEAPYQRTLREDPRGPRPRVPSRQSPHLHARDEKYSETRQACGFCDGQGWVVKAGPTPDATHTMQPCVVCNVNAVTSGNLYR